MPISPERKTELFTQYQERLTSVQTKLHEFSMETYQDAPFEDLNTLFQDLLHTWYLLYVEDTNSEPQHLSQVNEHFIWKDSNTRQATPVGYSYERSKMLLAQWSTFYSAVVTPYEKEKNLITKTLSSVAYAFSIPSPESYLHRCFSELNPLFEALEQKLCETENFFNQFQIEQLISENTKLETQAQRVKELEQKNATLQTENQKLTQNIDRLRDAVVAQAAQPVQIPRALPYIALQPRPDASPEDPDFLGELIREAGRMLFGAPSSSPR